MGNRVYVGNLPFNAGEMDLQNHFATKGVVKNCRIMIDRETGRSRGFGFVTMSTDAEAGKAISELNGVDFLGRRLIINEAREREAGTAQQRSFTPRNQPVHVERSPRPVEMMPSYPISEPEMAMPTGDRNSRRRSFNSNRRRSSFEDFEE